MNTRQNSAIEAFRGGLNCAQAVLMAFTDDLHIDKKIALSLSCGFGAGMGRLQDTCGAVTGSYMALSSYACNKYTENGERKTNSYALIQVFHGKFIALHGTSVCRDLIGCNLLTDEGRKFASDNNVFGTVCEKCITDSIEILEELMS